MDIAQTLINPCKNSDLVVARGCAVYFYAFWGVPGLRWLPAAPHPSNISAPYRALALDGARFFPVGGESERRVGVEPPPPPPEIARHGVPG